MANYPQQDDCSGVWKLKDVNNAVQGGYWRVGTGRALFSGGNDGSGSDGSNIIDFVTITTNGNAADFGDLTAGAETAGGFASHTRFFALQGGSPSNAIDYVNVMTTGNAADFGDATAGTFFRAGASNAIRGIFAGGDGSPDVNVIDYITMDSLGNAADFGDLTVARRAHSTHASSPTRTVFTGGQTPTAQNVMDFITIASQGNAIDFGDLTTARKGGGACDNAHGGL